MRPDEVCVGGARYELSDRVLGAGGFATVYEARGPDGGLVAVKVVDRTHLSGQVRAQLSCEREALELAQAHPRIIRFYGEAVQGVYQMFVMEAVSGGDLLDRVLERQGLPEREAQSIMRQVIQALRWLHDRRIVHGDVKPENILCCGPNSSRIKLADFGLASILPAGEKSVSRPKLVGSALYTAPEQNLSFSADMWSAGITAYVLISGKFPFGTIDDARSLAPSFAADCWRNISSDGPAFISQLLATAPETRLSAVEASHHAWLKLHINRWKSSVFAEPMLHFEVGTIRKHARNPVIDVPRKRQSLGYLNDNMGMGFSLTVN
ncbi:hypothetical protein AB1Y20_010457 [Prymnesium parvum]|uniref:Protein kinase domain-containing protein n=1 Tax=Prymnesium parvum TaxID=97485 RepID=A0AB34IRJ7_PRYPA